MHTQKHRNNQTNDTETELIKSRASPEAAKSVRVYISGIPVSKQVIIKEMRSGTF